MASAIRYGGIGCVIRKRNARPAAARPRRPASAARRSSPRAAARHGDARVVGLADARAVLRGDPRAREDRLALREQIRLLACRPSAPARATAARRPSGWSCSGRRCGARSSGSVTVSARPRIGSAGAERVRQRRPCAVGHGLDVRSRVSSTISRAAGGARGGRASAVPASRASSKSAAGRAPRA